MINVYPIFFYFKCVCVYMKLFFKKKNFSEIKKVFFYPIINFDIEISMFWFLNHWEKWVFFLLVLMLLVRVVFKVHEIRIYWILTDKILINWVFLSAENWNVWRILIIFFDLNQRCKKNLFLNFSGQRLHVRIFKAKQNPN